jgi:hypothetical protein
MSERSRDWTRFQLHLGLKIVQLTGDREANYHELASAHIIMSVVVEHTHGLQVLQVASFSSVCLHRLSVLSARRRRSGMPSGEFSTVIVASWHQFCDQL